MIVTGEKRVPLRWIVVSILPWSAVVFKYQVMGAAFIFSLKKFVDNPAGLTLILSLPGLLSIFIAPLSSFLSDRVWTRFGRRKPFIIVSWIGVAACMILMPLTPNLWLLVAVFVLYGVFNDIGSPVEVINQEIVPSPQRGRATAGMQWCSNFSCLIFYLVALGRFDEVSFLAGVPIAGEAAIYWSGGLLIVIMALLVMLGIKELNPHSALAGQRLTVRNFFTGILDRELWPVYSLIFASAMLSSGLGAVGNLLYTEQWGFTKQDIGINVAVGTTLNLVLIAVLGIFADRFNRMRTYQALIIMALVLKVAYYVYIEYILPDKRPTLVEIILFGELMSVVAILTNVVYAPLVYDYVTRNKMGTYSAGAGMVTRLTQLLTLNGVGLFIWGYALLFQPPAGDMVRVVFRDPLSAQQVRTALAQGAWTYSDDWRPAAASSLIIQPWSATGATERISRCWEIRLANADSAQLSREKLALEQERSPLLSEEKRLRDAASAAAADAMREQIDQLTQRIARIDGILAARAGHLREQAAQVLSAGLLAGGEQVLDASVNTALLLEVATSARPNVRVLDEILRELRGSGLRVIDLRPVRQGDGYGVAASLLVPSGADPAAAADQLRNRLQQSLTARSPGVQTHSTTATSYRECRALRMDLRILEDALDHRISPVTRIANWVQGWFAQPPMPDRRLVATSRQLRETSHSGHVWVAAPEGQAHTISVITLLGDDAPPTDVPGDEVSRRLQHLLGQTNPGTEAQARAFYDQVVTAAAAQRMTVARPFVAAAYAPLQYDYMCGYVWMFLLGLIGLAITFAFGRLEGKGWIRKRGLEECMA